MVIGLTDRQWSGLVRALGMVDDVAALAAKLDLDLRDEGNRFSARKEITAVFAPWFARHDYSEIAALFDKAGLTWAPFRSFAEAVRDDPDLSEDNPMMTLLDQPGIGTYPVPGNPVNWGALPRVSPVRAPRLGEHSEAVLADVLGMGSGEIGRLMDARIVAGA
jgi:2-methylfumaryl-CoA isomerase